MNGKAAAWILISLTSGAGTGWWWRSLPGHANSVPVPLAGNWAMAGGEAGPDARHKPEKSAPGGLAAVPGWNAALSAEDNELAIYEALAEATPAQITAWLEGDFRMPPGYSRGMVNLVWERTQSALIDRLQEKDPVAFGRWVSRIPVGSANWVWTGNAANALNSAGTPEAAEVAALLKAAHPDAWRAAEQQALAETDPEAALALSLSGNHYGLPDACAELLAADPERARAYLEKNPRALSAVAAALQRRSPQALEEFAGSFSRSPGTEKMLWGMVAADKARGGDGKAMAEFLKSHAVHEVPVELLRDANSAALPDLMKGLTGDPALQCRVLNALAAVDPAQAARYLTDSPDALAMLDFRDETGLKTVDLSRQLAGSWGLADPAAFKAWVHSLSPELQAKLMPVAAQSFAGREFLDFTRGMALSPEALQSFGRQAAAGGSDAATLLDWAGSFPEAQREKLLADMCRPLAERDLAAATALASGLPDFQQRAQRTGEVAGAAGFQNPTQAIAWGNGLPADLRITGVSAALRSLARNPEDWTPELRDVVTQMIHAEPDGTKAVWSQLAVQAVESTAFVNLQEGVEFWTGLPEELRETTWELLGNNIINKFGSIEFAKVTQEIDQIQNPELRRRIAGQMSDYSSHIAGKVTPEQAAALSKQLEAWKK